MLGPMLFVGCSGFALPVSRYWGSFSAIEIVETELGPPGEGTLKRWVREAPKGYGFSMLAPRSWAAGGFVYSEATTASLLELATVNKTVQAKALVLVVPADFKPNRANKSALKTFLPQVTAAPGLPPLVLDAVEWEHNTLCDLAADSGTIVAKDPLRDKPTKNKAKPGLSYLRMPGPSGPRSRYDDAALEAVAAYVRENPSDTTFCTFANADSAVNAKKLATLIG